MKAVLSTRQVCFVNVDRSPKPVATAMLAKNLMMNPAMTVGAPFLPILGSIARKHPELVCCVVLPLLLGVGLIFNGLQMYQGQQKICAE